ncbi:hypothetical protein [Streptomyces sp. NPDC048644]|uniref:hypothetical protein n=1 Tax=Streptomyces sp. NPDC048644 TaxID=3365582 RepID=UPI003722AA71
MSLSTYRQEDRADKAAHAEQRRLNAAAADDRRARRQQAEDERTARLREQARTDKSTDRIAREQRRQERAERRQQALTPERIYRTGTLSLVVASGLASLPAQILHFVGISPMLLPVPLGVEGAAWVMAAGVAYADTRGAPAWVRWLLRALVAAAAGFAASINYGYGLHLSGLSAADAQAAGVGLAAVTLLGPVVFEIRQWVSTLAARDEDARERRRHAARRRRHHRRVRRVATRLLSAAPLGTLSESTAWEQAWEIVHGSDKPGMTPELHSRANRAAAEMADTLAQNPANTKKTTEDTANQSGSDLCEPARSGRRWSVRIRIRPTRRTRKRVGSAPKPTDAPPVVPVGRPAAVAAAASTRPRRATGRVPDSARTARPRRTPDQLLAEARSVTADWSADELTADRIRKAVRTSAAGARTLRDTLRAERTTTDAPAA